LAFRASKGLVIRGLKAIKALKEVRAVRAVRALTDQQAVFRVRREKSDLKDLSVASPDYKAHKGELLVTMALKDLARKDLKD
jgi:hypothetical protein